MEKKLDNLKLSFSLFISKHKIKRISERLILNFLRISDFWFIASKPEKENYFEFLVNEFCN